MSTALNVGYIAPCVEGVGGLKIVRVCRPEDIRFCIEVDGVVEYIVMNEGKVFFGFQLPKHVCSFTITPVASVENNVSFYTEAVNLVINKMSKSSSLFIQALAAGPLVMIAEDYNGEGYLLGRENGLDLSGGMLSSGTVKGDRNGYDLSFSGEEKKISHIGRDFIDSFYKPTSDRYFILVNDNEFLIDSDNKFITY